MFGVTTKGFHIKTYGDILEDMKERAKEYFGEDTDLTDSSPLCQFLESIAYEIADQWMKMEAVYYSAFIGTATGLDLDRVVALVGISRKAASKAQGSVTFSRSLPSVSDIMIPTGTMVATADTTQIFTTTEDVILHAGTKLVDAPILAVGAGSAGNVQANTITRIMSPISGIEGLTNTSPTNGGGDAESDNALRVRATTLKPTTKATSYALASALLTLDGVLGVNVSEDVLNHSCSIAIAGGDEAQINSTIEQTRPCGIAVSWTWSATTPVTVTANVSGGAGYSSADVETEIQDVVNIYIGGLEIGADIEYSVIAGQIIGAKSVKTLNSLSVSAEGTTISSLGETLAIPNDKKPVSGTYTITVV